jgi:hypothetical protein
MPPLLVMKMLNVLDLRQAYTWHSSKGGVMDLACLSYLEGQPVEPLVEGETRGTSHTSTEEAAIKEEGEGNDEIKEEEEEDGDLSNFKSECGQGNHMLHL